MRRTTRFLAPLAGALALVIAFPALATASPSPTPQKTVSFSASSYAVSEAAGHATITVRRPAGGARITVRFATFNGTAAAPRDYTATSRTLTFPAGSNTTTLTVPVPVRDNSGANADRTFTVTLSQPSGGYRLASPSTATVRIVNDDVPAAPSGLTATTVGSHEIDLHWTANSDHVTGYRILRSTTSAGPYTQVGTGTTNSYQNTGLAAGTYYYVVQAVNPAGRSASSGKATATLVGDVVPAAPSGLTATGVGTDEIDLAWTANSDVVTGYRILRSTTLGGPYAEVGTSTTNSYQDTGLTAGTYYYVVQAVNPAGNSPSSGEATATLTPIQIGLVYDGGFEDGLTAGWYVSTSDGSTTTLDSTAPHGGTYSAHLSTDGSQLSYPQMQAPFTMPGSGTVTFTAWYRAALADGDIAHISVFDFDTQEYLFTDVVTDSAASWTETDAHVLDASTRPGHLMVILVDLVGAGVSSFDVDDFTALAN